jgi:hypothetical protein
MTWELWATNECFSSGGESTSGFNALLSREQGWLSRVETQRERERERETRTFNDAVRRLLLLLLLLLLLSSLLFFVLTDLLIY